MFEKINKIILNLKNSGKQKQFLAFAAFSIVFFILFLLFVFSLLRGDIANKEDYVPKDGPGDRFNESYKKAVKKNEKFVEEGFMVTKLIEALPYSGKDFILSYDYGDGLFTLVLNQNNTNEGLSEYNEFLTKNNVKPALVEENLIKKYSSEF